MRVCGKLCETQEVVTLLIEEGRIAGSCAGMVNADLGSPDVWLSAGFLDLQLNGYGGCAFNRRAGVPDHAAAVGEFRTILDYAARAGSPLVCPTITTDSPAVMLAGLRALAHAVDSDPEIARAVPGIHVEGPYLSPDDGPRGAHPLEHIRDPDWEEFQRYQDAAAGLIRLVTLAPERPGSLAFIEKLASSGIVVALGHTAAEPETIRDAVRAGARMSTHLGNGAHGQIRRHPNYIWEQLAHDDLYASLIVDGFHLPPSVVKVFARAKGLDRLALVSDAVSLGGLPPGQYSDGRHEVLTSGKIVLAGTPYLAGSGHLLDTGVANACRFAGLSIAQAARAASAIPARILGIEDRKGHVRAGADADLTLFQLHSEGPLEIAAALRAGEVVYRA